MISKFEALKKNKIDEMYLTESMRTENSQTIHEYWYEGDATYSGDFYFWPQWMFQYYYELPTGETIESAYLTWKSE